MSQKNIAARANPGSRELEMLHHTFTNASNAPFTASRSHFRVFSCSETMKSATWETWVAAFSSEDDDEDMLQTGQN